MNMISSEGLGILQLSTRACLARGSIYEMVDAHVKIRRVFVIHIHDCDCGL